MNQPEQSPASQKPTPMPGRACWHHWTSAWAMLPVRAFVVALLVTSMFWGRFLLPSSTMSPERHAPSVNPTCRVGTAQLMCQSNYGGKGPLADAGAPTWQNLPADYFFHRAQIRNDPHPSWNPYIGSGYPIALDGHNVRTSPTQWFTARFPGDQTRDVITFIRFLLWTFAIVWAVGLCGASTLILAGIAAAAALAPYAGIYGDIVFLDSELLGPWFLLIVLAFVKGKLSLRLAAGLSIALGALVGAMAFPGAQVVLCAAMGVLGFTAVPNTRGRSLILAACLGIGMLVALPTWLAIANNLDQLFSSRDVMCISQEGQGVLTFWRGLVHPSFAWNQFALSTLVGTGLLLLTPRRWWFVTIAAIVIGVWTVVGLPQASCSLPFVSGVRFVRHLLPHFQMLFIFIVGIVSQSLSERLDRRWPWLVFIAAFATSVWLAIGMEPEPIWAAIGVQRAGLFKRVLACSAFGAILGLLAIVLRSRSGPQETVRHAAFGLGLVLFTFPPYFFGSQLPGSRGGVQLDPMPTDIDPSTALGLVQKLSQGEDRRHYSPGGFFYPNWSAAFGIMDMLSLYALYPKSYHELNSTLFKQWPDNSSQMMHPDRFVHVDSRLVMSKEFQRLMVLNRVSLLTFRAGQASFAEPGSPYETSKCRLLARTELQGAESYVCSAVSGVGYFPEVVRTVKKQTDALEILGAASPAELVNLALLGPEMDTSIAGSTSVDPVPGAGRVISVDRRGDDLTYILEVEREGIFVIADTYFRGWTATVNGRAAGISRANIAFKAVRVPMGRVELKLHFAVSYSR